MADHTKFVENIEAEIRPIRLAYVKLKRYLEATAARHQVDLFSVLLSVDFVFHLCFDKNLCIERVDYT